MVIIWGINFPIAKSALSELDPLAFNALRFPLAALVMFVAIRIRGTLHWPPPGERLRVLLLSILGNVAYQQFFIHGLQLTSAGTASVLLAGTPIITAVLSARLGHERLTARVWLGVVGTVAGMTMVVGFGAAGEAQAHSVAGDLLMICASLSWAVYTVGSRSLVDRHGAVQFTAWTLWIGAAILGIIGLPSVLQTDLAAVSAAAWMGVAYAGALSIGIAYLIWYHGVRQIGNTGTATYSNLTPVVALAASWIALGEQPLAGQLLGAMVIIAGVTLAQRRVRRPAV